MTSLSTARLRNLKLFCLWKKSSILSRSTKYSQMRDGGGVGKSSFRYNRDIISVKRQDSQILQSSEGIFLDALELVVGHDQGGEPAQVGEHEGRQHRDLVVAEVAEKFWWKLVSI